ncbi:hypothetical protein GGX14DRAFT_412152 [Mycena pura]|uniref:Polyadenylation factor subunit 2 n=1 Tax=Mycena pura TaxID=153505 RepID=A0AAD6YS82_9AGAR|nr:hypothetical protein GGX14DRAFT_412152 [Mycena pura]
MSSGGGYLPVTKNGPFNVIDDAGYRANKEQLDRALEKLNAAIALNEQGKRNYDQVVDDLQRRVKEGQEAQRMLAAIQSSQPLLTYVDATPTPTARIEEVPSPVRNHTSQTSNYDSVYFPQQQTQSYGDLVQPNQSSQPYQMKQKSSSSSSLYNALGAQRAAATTAQSGAIPSQRIATPPYFPPKTQTASQPYWYSQQRDPVAANSTAAAQTQSRTSYQPNAHHSIDTMPPQPNPMPQAQAHGLPPATLQPPVAQQRPSPVALHQPYTVQPAQQPPTIQQPNRSSAQFAVPQSQPAQANSQVRQSQAQQADARPNAASESQTSRSQPIAHQSRAAVTPSLAQTQAVPSQDRPSAVQRHTPVAQQQPPTVQQPLMTQQPLLSGAQVGQVKSQPQQSASPPLATSTRTGSQPMASSSAHPVTGKTASSQITVTGASSVNANKLQPANDKHAPPQGGAGLKTLNESQQGAAATFLFLINAWQKVAPQDAFLDVPQASLRVMKHRGGEIHFLTADFSSESKDMKRLSPREACARITFQGSAGVFVDPDDRFLLLQQPVSSKLYRPFGGVPAKDAPDAVYSEPARSTSIAEASDVQSNGVGVATPRTPKTADKRFMAHDVLRALGKAHLYAADDDSVRYAKRRAVESPKPELAPDPATVRSNEASARTTPSSRSSPSRSTSRSRKSRTPDSSRVPLFLPDDSASASPVPLRPPAIGTENKGQPKDLKNRPKSPPFYVLVTRFPYAKRNEAKIRERQQKEQEQLMGEEAAEREPEDLAALGRQRALGMYQNVHSEAEAAAMLDACSRLHESPCKWVACDAVLNSVENLVTHLLNVHAQEDKELPTCLWNVCGEIFPTCTALALHAETHVLDTIRCAYEDCDEVRHTPGELVKHNWGHAEENRALRLSARPSVPSENLPLPPVPGIINAWEVLAPAVQMPDISSVRHMSLGPWVLRNICAPATRVRARRYNAALPLRGNFLADYEFVETSSKQYSSMPSQPARARDFPDLESKAVSIMFEEGRLVLWPPQGGGHRLDDERRDSFDLDNRPMDDEEPLSEMTVTGDGGDSGGPKLDLNEMAEDHKLDVDFIDVEEHDMDANLVDRDQDHLRIKLADGEQHTVDVMMLEDSELSMDYKIVDEEMAVEGMLQADHEEAI